MSGSVNIGDISDPLADRQELTESDEEDLLSLSELFYVGQTLPCYVLEVLSQQKYVPVALNPRLVNCHLTAKSLRPNMVIVLL